MVEIESLLEKIEYVMKNIYSPPLKLFYKMDSDNPLDKENMSYILKGGEAGIYYHWLALLVRFTQPKCILELGSRYGISTVMLYSELPIYGQLISVNTEKDQRYVPDEIWSDERVRFIYGDCLDLNIYRGSIPVNIDILWTDTVHSYEQIRDEFEIYEPLLADESIIVIADINLNDKKDFFDESQYQKFDLTPLCHVSGFGVIRYSRKKSKSKNFDERKIQATLRSISIWKRREPLLIKKSSSTKLNFIKFAGNHLPLIISNVRILKQKYYQMIRKEKTSSSYQSHHSQYVKFYSKDVAFTYEWYKKINLFNDSYNRFFDLINEHPEVTSVAIDIGSGAGWISAELSHHFRQVISIEPSGVALQIAQTLFPRSQYSNIEWKHGFAEEELHTINLSEAALFITGCVLSHLQDDIVINICKGIEIIAPKGSILAFSEAWGRESHEYLWHIRTPSWWQKQLPSWELDFFGPEIENTCGRHKGFHGVKVK